MAVLTASCAALRPSSVSVQRPGRSVRTTVCAAAKPQEQKVHKVAQVAAAGIAALWLVAAPAFADIPLKNKICAAQPTAKICLRDSVKK